MIKRLSSIGNSLGLIIERPILELLHIDRDTDLEVETDGKALVIRPAKLNKKDQALKSARRVMKIHEETLKKLAK